MCENYVGLLRCHHQIGVRSQVQTTQRNSIAFWVSLLQEGYCHCAEEDHCEVVKFKRLVTVKKLDEKALIQGLAKFGPASIAISVGRKSLKFYSSGVYDDPECSKSENT